MRRDEAIAVVRRELAACGIAEPYAEARRLLLRSLDLSAEALLMNPAATLTPFDVEALSAWCARRVGREPLGRIAGEREFYGRIFRLSEGTLEPRPDSETLIDASLELLARQGKLNGPLRIIDVGTGSGCLLLTLLAELPHATGVGTDISADALKTAAVNAHRLGLSDRVSWKQMAGLDQIDETFDLLVSNPPYIPTAAIAGLDPEVRCFDPLAALDGGADGLDVYRAIAREHRRVVPEGISVLEFGVGQAMEVIRVFEQLVWTGAEESRLEILGKWRDLGGHERCVAFRTLCKR